MNDLCSTATGSSKSSETASAQLKEPFSADIFKISKMTQKELGTLGERLAREYLKEHNFEILESNWTCEAGEVDIVALERVDTSYILVFIEVKTRKDTRSQSIEPELAVTAYKQKKYRKIARAYISEHSFSGPVRFDVIALRILSDHIARLRHLRDAFE